MNRFICVCIKDPRIANSHKQFRGQSGWHFEPKFVKDCKAHTISANLIFFTVLYLQIDTIDTTDNLADVAYGLHTIISNFMVKYDEILHGGFFH